MNSNAVDNTSLLWGGKLNLTDSVSTQLHFHRQTEFLFVKKGGLRIELINGMSLELSEGDIAVIKPFEMHQFIPDDGKSLFLLAVLPDKLSLKMPVDRIRTEVFSDYDSDIKALIDSYELYGKLKEKYRIIFYYTVAEIVRNLFEIKSENTADSSVLQYISSHYREPLSLSEVAAACSTNRSVVSHAVNSYYGCNFNKCVNRLRIADFIEMYKGEEGNKTIEALANKAGFKNMRTFYRCFYEQIGCSPKEYIDI